LATTGESLIGATLQSRFTWLTNEVVNMIDTTLRSHPGDDIKLWLEIPAGLRVITEDRFQANP
jgi:hypothetical protein